MNEYDQRQLLCTFSNTHNYQNTLKELKSFYSVYSGRIFVFSNVIDPKELFLTYNVIDMKKDSKKFPNTILIHRKKQTNTLYSLNALNTLIKEENGSFDKTFILDWKLYSNSLVISSDVSVRIIALKIFSVVD